MARTQLVLDGLDLNDGVYYRLRAGMDIGAPLLTYDEYRGYGGAVMQANVSTAGLVSVSVPLDVRAPDLATLATKVGDLNAKIAGCTFTSPKNLLYAGATYSIVHSPQVSAPRDELYMVCFVARLSFTLNRLP